MTNTQPKHTPAYLVEKLRKGAKYIGGYPVYLPDNRNILTVFNGLGDDNTEQFTDKLIARYNACAGIPTEALEQGRLLEYIDVAERLYVAAIGLVSDDLLEEFNQAAKALAQAKGRTE